MNTSKNKYGTINSFLLLLFFPFVLIAQQTLTLDECFDRVTKNHPIAEQIALLRTKSNLDLEAINKEKLPQLDINAQATYQSDVTHLPVALPNITVNYANKDQYKATLDASLPIYNGGLIDAKARLEESNTSVGLQEVEVNLYALKSSINELYLSILLIQENRSLLEAKEKQLQTRLKEVKAGVEYGTLLPTSADALVVELLKIKQNYAELDHSKSSLLKRLSFLIGNEINNNIVLQTPTVKITNNPLSQRPELTLFGLQKNQIEKSIQQLSKSKLPKLNAFVQGGYGNPGLNMLDNTFTTYYYTGLRLNWNVFDWNKNKTERQSLAINKDIIDSQEKTFELNNNLELVQIQSEIDKLNEYLTIDQEIIPIRENMVKSAASQLKNGVITSSAYMSEFTDLYEAKSNLNLHRIQLLLQQIKFQITNGTYGTN
ncbi:TolC family protein [Maribacter sp. TH_r10]|uniref:TolC family protein n=1 Tax=Maribacter sp. TH_r10 TaxID=3082086 RepID=UPI00295404EA|nr:TolC family protein [Maribacter sp. TH_r10]MDV7139857.1 TolC family protein [Maribacter sp. TH_r10]